MRRSISPQMYTPPESPVRSLSAQPAEIEFVKRIQPVKRPAKKRNRMWLITLSFPIMLLLYLWGPCYFLYYRVDVDFTYLSVTDTCKFYRQLTSELNEIHRRMARDYVDSPSRDQYLKLGVDKYIVSVEVENYLQFDETRRVLIELFEQAIEKGITIGILEPLPGGVIRLKNRPSVFSTHIITTYDYRTVKALVGLALSDFILWMVVPFLLLSLVGFVFFGRIMSILRERYILNAVRSVLSTSPKPLTWFSLHNKVSSSLNFNENQQLSSLWPAPQSGRIADRIRRENDFDMSLRGLKTNEIVLSIRKGSW